MNKLDSAVKIIEGKGDCREVEICYYCPFFSDLLKQRSYNCLALLECYKLKADGIESSNDQYKLMKVKMAEEYLETQKKLKYLEKLTNEN
jgi:hypothetical protein